MLWKIQIKFIFHRGNEKFSVTACENEENFFSSWKVVFFSCVRENDKWGDWMNVYEWMKIFFFFIFINKPLRKQKSSLILAQKKQSFYIFHLTTLIFFIKLKGIWTEKEKEKAKIFVVTRKEEKKIWKFSILYTILICFSYSSSSVIRDHRVIYFPNFRPFLFATIINSNLKNWEFCLF